MFWFVVWVIVFIMYGLKVLYFEILRRNEKQMPLKTGG